MKNHKNEKIFIFGFTSIIYEYFIKLNYKLNLKNSILIHGGGWKKIEKLGITNKIFKKKLNEKFAIKKIINYYGMIEQTGSIFFECPKCENFLSTKYSDIIVRDEKLNIQKKNKLGIIQTLSSLPSSYPGNTILTEDMGMIVDGVNCKCNKSLTKFRILKRLQKSEIRGCSDAV